MSLAQGFKIRYGNADELDNYDPTIQVYENQTFIGGTQYNIFQQPQFDETSKRTILNDENGDDDPNRLIVSNRCLVGDGISTLDVKGNLTGTITAKAYTTNTASGEWALNDITLSSGVLTLASGTYYKTIVRYVNGVLFDHVPLEDAPSGFDGANTLSTTGEKLTLTSSDYTLIRTVRSDIPWDASFGDRYGYSKDLASLDATDYDVNDSVFTSNLSASNRYRTANSLILYGIDKVVATQQPIVNPTLNEESGLKANYFSTFQDGTVSTQRLIKINKVFQNAEYKLVLESDGNFRTVFRDNLYLRLQPYLESRPDPSSDLAYSVQIGETDYYTVDSVKTWYDNNASEQLGFDLFFGQLEEGLTYATIYQYWASTSTLTSDISILSMGILYFEINHNGAETTYSSDLIKANSSSSSSSRFVRGSKYWVDHQTPFSVVDYNYMGLTAANSYGLIKQGSFIGEIPIIPVDEQDKTIDAVNNEPLTFARKKQFQALRQNNQAAYFDTGSYLTPLSGNISSATITNTFGTAQWSISGNNIACTASGSCHGIRLDSGQIYTMSEGYFGNASEYIYDASSTSGVNLQVNGQTADATWQQATGLTDFGYDWLSIYGGHRYTNGTTSEDIFVPHILNTDNVVTESLLPSGYTLQGNLDRGVFVRDGSEWLLASGQVSQYRSELDSHTVGTTPFTEDYKHYVTETSTGTYTRWVIYPENLSKPANTVVDFIQDNLDTVAITYQAADVSTLSQMNSSYTKRIKLPATKQNSDLFDYIYDVNNRDFGTLKTKKDCEISVEGTEILRGKAIVEAVRQKDVAESYDLYVQGDNFNLWEQLDAVSVSGLDLGSFTLNVGNVESSWDYTSASGNVVFAPIDFGQFVNDTVKISDLTPSYFIRNILTKGFQQIGIAYESTFLDSDYAKRLVTPTVGKWRLSDADYDLIKTQTNFGASAFTISGGDTISGNGSKQYINNLTQVTSNANYNDATSTLTVAHGAFAYFRFSALVSKTGALVGGNRQVTIGYDINGITAQSVTTFSVFNNEPLPQLIQLIGQKEVQILPGDIIKPWIVAPFDVGISNISWSANAVYKMPEDVTLTLNKYLPKPKSDTFTVFDLLRGLAQTFNLQFYYNPFSKILKFEPYQDFYSGERDWSDKWDNSKDKEVRYLGLTLTQDIWHKYKDDDSDRYLKRYKESGVDYASYKLELPDNFKRGETVVRNEVFAATVDRVASFGTIPTFNYDSDNKQVESLDFQLRILYYEGKDTSGTFKMAIGQVGNTTVNFYDYLPRLAFREAKTGANWQSLAYDSTDSRVGLFETYYSPKYRNIYEGVTATYYLNLSPSDIIDDPLTRVIFLDNARWYINRIIDYNPISQEATKVELIKVVDFNFPIVKTRDPLIDIITGKRLDPISYKPNRDLPDNPGFDMSEAPNHFVQGNEDVQGSSFGAEHETPKRSATWAFGRGLKTYYSNQYLFGTWNEPNEDAILQIGGGTGSGERYTAFEVVRGDLGYDAKLSGDKVLIGESYEASGHEVRSTKLKHGTVDITTGSGSISFLDVGSGLVFSSAPIVTLTMKDYTEASNYHYYVENVTVSGCDVKGFKETTGMTQTFNYIAIGE